MSEPPVSEIARDPARFDYTTPQLERPQWAWAGGWAIFLACSWTWCIGMFLPVLLVRDYGLWGWIVFAIPNVIGASAMGWMLRTRESSDAIVANHAAAIYAFSLVTVAFHIFFVLFILHRWMVYEFNTYIWVALLAAAMFAVGRRRGAIDLVIAVIVFAVSVGAMIAFIGTVGVTLPANGGLRPKAEIFPLAAACVFGFALCPYLDGTFHRARAATSAHGAKLAFGAGFGVFFLAMIVFTLLYAQPLAEVLSGSDVILPAGVVIAIAVHMVVQSSYTVAVHARQSRSMWRFVAGACLAAFTLTFIGWSVAQWTRLAADEVVYRLFMSFYGLIFPAYVWVCMIPGRGRSRPDQQSWALFTAAVVIAAPMFAIAFLGNRMMWLIPALIVVLLARLACTGSTQPRDRSPSPPPA